MNPQWETQERATCVVDFQTNDSYKSVRLVNQNTKRYLWSMIQVTLMNWLF